MTCRDTQGCIHAKMADMAKANPALVTLAGNAKEVVYREASRKTIADKLEKAIQKFLNQHIAPFFKQGRPPWLQQVLADVRQVIENKLVKEQVGAQSSITAEKQIRRAADMLEGMVISQLDKNNGCLHVQCEAKWHVAYHRTFAGDHHYEKIPHDQKSELEQQRQDYNMTDLGKVAKWDTKGKLPYAYILKKDKNIDKCRPVVACVDHPARKAMTIAAKGGALVLRLLSRITEVKHFDLQDVAALAATMADNEGDNADTVLSAFDITEMFTALKTTSVLPAAWDLLMLVGNTYAGMNTRFYMKKGNMQQAHIGRAPCAIACHTATLGDIYQALEYDMGHTVFTAGDVILRQVNGIGIGGIMSPFAARCVCIMREWRWRQQMQRTLRKPMTICRLMDDSGMKHSVADGCLLFMFQHGAYPRECTLVQDVNRAKSMKFVGCDIHVRLGIGTVVVAHNKNMIPLMTTGQIKYQRFPHWDSELRAVVKIGTVIGQVIYMVRTTSWNGYAELLGPLWALMLEFHLKKYPWSILYRTLRHMDTCRLPVQTEGSGDFTKTWYKLLDGLKLLSAGHTITIGITMDQI
jgi:hypothetical protein